LSNNAVQGALSRREFPAAPIAGVGGVVLRDDCVLLVLRGNPPLEGEWSLPGGAVELGETLREACAREVLEETGLHVTVLDLVELIDRIVLDESERMTAEAGNCPEDIGEDAVRGSRVRYHYVLADFLCEVAGGELGAASDAAEVRWVKRVAIEDRSFEIADLARQVILKASSILETRRLMAAEGMAEETGR
jgi:8-oxo-dGTP diphosphatase